MKGIGRALIFLLALSAPLGAYAQDALAPTPPSVELAPDVRDRFQREFELLQELRQAAMVRTSMVQLSCDRPDPAPLEWCARMGAAATQARTDYENARQSYERRHAEAVRIAHAQPLWRELGQILDPGVAG